MGCRGLAPRIINLGEDECKSGPVIILCGLQTLQHKGSGGIAPYIPSIYSRWSKWLAVRKGSLQCPLPPPPKKEAPAFTT